MAQKSGYNWFHREANIWETIHLVPDMAPPLLAEEEGPPTYKELNSGVIHTNTFL
jgi:hypothetical protein